jgi:hypothetical protein
VIEPLLPEMPPFFPPDLDPDGHVRREAYEAALAAAARKRVGTATIVEPPTMDRGDTVAGQRRCATRSRGTGTITTPARA